ncbi:mannosyltransferase putative-domain-containing protein [Helicostylum pulchrum]|nr:mannosyltransferase putative-domain-containing protein [Helicostylum pulchrum]
MICPNCQQSETAINEIDNSICCTNCGNVLETYQIVPGRDGLQLENHEPVDKPVENKKYIECFVRIASYFGLGKEIVELCKVKLNESRHLLPIGYADEVAVGTVICFGSFLHPEWMYDDYIAAFPLPLYKPAIIKTYLLLGGDNYGWAKSMDNQLDYVLEYIYPTILDQLFITKPPRQFNIDSLKINTRKLLHLGGQYGLNYGLKIRPLIVAVACVCALHLRSKIPSKYLSGRGSKAKRNAAKLSNSKANYHYNWSFKAFALMAYCSERFLRKCYSIYYRFITLCVQKFNWLSQPVDCKEVCFHLDDVLTLFSKVGKEEDEPMMTLPRGLFFPISFVESMLNTRLTIDSLKQARKHLRDDHGGDTELMDKESITFCFYRLLKEGYSEKQLSLLSVFQIRNLCYIVDYRLTFENIHDKNNYLDRELIAEDDMCDEEINFYLLELEQNNTLLKEQEDHEEQIKEKLALEEKEIQRVARILNNRAVVEPELTLENTRNLNDSYYIAVPTRAEPWKPETLELLNSPIGQVIQADLFTVPELLPSFKALTTQERLFKSLFQYFDPIIAEGVIDVSKHQDFKETWLLYTRLERILFPWIRPNWKSAFDINLSSSGGKGIVMCVGDGQFMHASTSVKAIRELLKSDLPIEIFYIDEYDLSIENRDYFDAIPNVKTKSIDTYINNAYTRLGGWSIKPFAILASSFDEVMMMDADVFMFNKPETFFEDKGYQKTGALFFLDRTLFDNFYEGKKWLRSFLPTYSSYLEQSRWWKTTSAHEQESGVVLMDKRKVLFGLLATCKMNDKNERDKVSYKHSHGDKETFWIGFEMIATPYSFVKSVGAVIGGLGDAGAAETVCGNQLHLDANNKPMWWNGGLLRDKNKWDDRYMSFTHFAQGEDWEFETSCVRETDKITELTKYERGIGNRLIEMDKKNK